jgi:hypothetical protein
MASRQYGDQRLLDQEFEGETGRLRLASKKRLAAPSFQLRNRWKGRCGSPEFVGRIADLCLENPEVAAVLQ